MKRAWFALLTLGTLGAARETPARPGDRVWDFPHLELRVTLPELEGLQPHDSDEEDGEPPEPLEKGWTGKLGQHEVRIGLSTFTAEERWLMEPGDVTDYVMYRQRQSVRRFRVVDQDYFEGEYGYAPFASLLAADVTLEDEESPSERHFVLGGLLPDLAYVLHVVSEPLPDEETEERIRAFLAEGVRYYGEAERDPDWTEEEVLERWLQSAPEALHEDFRKAMDRKRTAKKVRFRTGHYLIMTNSSGGKLFAKKLEENYDEVAETFPFREVEGRRLMPIFLFRTQGDYVEYHMKMTGSQVAAARRSAGQAWRDYYATWYESPNDPVHIHEQTHQIFRNRLRLNGGGSWFQEGVAEYIETSENDRNVVARLVRDGEATALRELMQLRSLLYSTEEDQMGGSRAGDNYKLAALLIEFLRESDFGEDRFEQFLYTLGKVPWNDLEAIEAGLREVYGVGIDEIQLEWREWARSR